MIFLKLFRLVHKLFTSKAVYINIYDGMLAATALHMSSFHKYFGSSKLVKQNTIFYFEMWTYSIPLISPISG